MTALLYQMEPVFDEDDALAVGECVRSTWVLEGERTTAFEQAVAACAGARYGVAVPSCTVALAISLMALGIGPGDEVIVPDLTFAATANAVNLAGATPVFVDIRPDTFGLDPAQIERVITPRTRVLLPVWFNGRDPGIRSLVDAARHYHLAVVEDAACALGSHADGQHAGTLGDLGCFSFNTTKIITTGGGGLIVTNDVNLYERIKRLKNHGRLDRRDYHPMIGFNFGFNDLLAALGLAQLKKLPQRVAWKKQLCRWYFEALADVGGIKQVTLDDAVCPWYPEVFARDPISLKADLAAQQIQTRSFYPPLHTQPAYQREGEFSVAINAAQRGLWLPAAAYVDQATVERVSAAVRAWATRFN
jgi:perosamine synthetase